MMMKTITFYKKIIKASQFTQKREMHKVGEKFHSNSNRMGLYKHSVLEMVKTLYCDKTVENYHNLPIASRDLYFTNLIIKEVFRSGTEIATQLDIVSNLFLVFKF